MTDIASHFETNKFIISESKSNAISNEVQKEKEKKEPSEQNVEDEGNSDINVEELKQKLSNLLSSNPNLLAGVQVEEFEKDNDKNFHIDFIAAAANNWAANYNL